MTSTLPPFDPAHIAWFDVKATPRNGDGCTYADIAVRYVGPDVEPELDPAPVNPYASRLSNKPKRRWFRPNRKDRT